MKGIFLSGQDKTEALLLKDIALSLHEEFDSIEIRYPEYKPALNRSDDCLFVIPESDLEKQMKSFEKDKFVPRSIVAVSKNKQANSGKTAVFLKKLGISSLLLTLDDLKNTVLLRKRLRQHLQKSK